MIGLAVGGATTVTGIAEQNRAHSNAVAQVNRQNAIAKQNYLNEISISAFRDQRKLDVFEAQLEADSQSKAAYYKQLAINQTEADNAKNAERKILDEKITKALFDSQANLAKSITAQGTILASGMQPGQSMLLELNQAERELGFEQAQIDASLLDATKAYGVAAYGIDLDQYGADSNAMSNIQTQAIISPTASFQTIRPSKIDPPKKPSILGPILSGVTAGLGAYSFAGGQGFGGKTKKPKIKPTQDVTSAQKAIKLQTTSKYSWNRYDFTTL
tara:strand:+ start:199 stop:1017 length:819 start_codon:yes stop_codon:yes gene_type:complete